MLSDFVSSQMTERELKNPNEVFARYTKRLPFDLVEYIRWDGLNMMNSTAGEKPFDASQRPYYTEGIKGNSGIWPNFTPKVAKEVLLNFYTPLYYNGEISGVITGAIGETSSLKPKLISSFFGRQVQSFVCDENYIVISSACEGIKPGLDVKKWDSVKILSDFMEHSRNSDEEPFTYKIDGKLGLCCTSAIKSNGWHVVVIVYPSVLKAAEKEVSGNLFTISVVIMIILFLYLMASLGIQAKANRIVQEGLKDAATRDKLTGLLNRHAYEDNLRLLESGKISENLCYVAFDVNGLKNVNDSLGHAAGDELIKAAAGCINRCFGQYGNVYRTGGDEFIAIINIGEEELLHVKNRFARETGAWKGQYTESLVIPAGYVMRKEMPDASLFEMTKAADQRMYREKTLIYISSGVDRRAKNEAYEILCMSYTKILKINLTSDEFSIIQMDLSEKEDSKGYRERISEWLYNFSVSGQVHGDDVEAFQTKTSADYMRSFFLSGKNELNVYYRRLIGEDFHKVLMQIKPAKDFSPDNMSLFLYVKDIDRT